MKEGLSLVSLSPSLSRNGRLSHLWLSLDPAQGGFGVRRRAELGSSLLREPPRTELPRASSGERGGAFRTRGHGPALRSPASPRRPAYRAVPWARAARAPVRLRSRLGRGRAPSLRGGGRGGRRSGLRKAEGGSRAAAGEEAEPAAAGVSGAGAGGRGSRAAGRAAAGGRPRPAPRPSAPRRARRRRLCCPRPAAVRDRGSARPGRRGLRAGPVGVPGAGAKNRRGRPGLGWRGWRPGAEVWSRAGTRWPRARGRGRRAEAFKLP